MKKDELDVTQYGCGRCGGRIPDRDPVVVCGCCLRTYCVWCATALRAYCTVHDSQVRCAMSDKTPCVRTLFEVIDGIEKDALLRSVPVPPREQGH